MRHIIGSMIAYLQHLPVDNWCTLLQQGYCFTRRSVELAVCLQWQYQVQNKIYMYLYQCFIIAIGIRQNHNWKNKEAIINIISSIYVIYIIHDS